MGPTAWRLVEGLTTVHCKELACYGMLHRTYDLHALVNTIMNLCVS
jgi:hypothetical protein